jgi:hypothetical protein
MTIHNIHQFRRSQRWSCCPSPGCKPHILKRASHSLHHLIRHGINTEYVCWVGMDLYFSTASSFEPSLRFKVPSQYSFDCQEGGGAKQAPQSPILFLGFPWVGTEHRPMLIRIFLVFNALVAGVKVGVSSCTKVTCITSSWPLEI